MENPFSIAFGKAPTQIVRRDAELQPIREAFEMTNPVSDAFVITGPRGSGKTVALSNLLDEYRQKPDWVVARLNIADNMLEQLASLIYEEGKVKKLFIHPELSLSFQGLSFSVSGESPVSSLASFFTRVLKHYKKKGIKVLVGVDDVVKCPEVAELIRTFQGFIIDHYDVRLIVTGLYDNIARLQEERSLTFFCRAPKISLKPLSLISIARSYSSVFKIDIQEAMQLAKITMGYAYAYQVLGNILFRDQKTTIDAAVLAELDDSLQNASYEIIWSELSLREKEIAVIIANGKTSNQEIQSSLGITKGYLSTYKDRLSKKGVIGNSERGKASFLLPRFKEFVLLKQTLDDVLSDQN